MRVAFYAPMKPPDHPVPSGDRRLARALLRALEHAGHTPELACHFVSRDGGGDAGRQAQLKALGEKLAARLARRLAARPAHLRPEIWFTYHVYHKAPDWLGPYIADALDIPYVIAEASSAPKRAGGPWDIGYRGANAAIARADAIFTVNSDDWDCLQDVVAEPVLHRRLLPFVDTAPYRAEAPRRANIRAAIAREHGWSADTPLLLTVGMMRPGDKRESYRQLAAALAELGDLDWRLLVAGDGPCREEITQELGAAAQGRAIFLGEVEETALPALLTAADIFAWPAVNEAFGMALLEAQAAGCPVVAGRVRGVPDIVSAGVTGLLSPPGDFRALAQDIRRLLTDEDLRQEFSRVARSRIDEQYDIAAAARRIDDTLRLVSMVHRAA